MSFQFIHVTPDRPEHDQETRRRIRSQAMRDYRRRQREVEDSSPSSKEASSTSPNSPRATSLDPSRRGHQWQQSADAMVGVTTHEPSDEHLRAERPGIRSSKSSTSDQAEQSEGSTRRQRRPQTLRAQRGSFNTFSVTLGSTSRTSSPRIEHVDQTTNESGQLGEMLDVCERYDQWLIPDESERPASFDMTGSMDSTTSEMLLFALCLKSIGHMEALNPGQTTYNRRLFKTKVLSICNLHLKDPAKALEDETLGALACLTSYEISRGSREAILHLTGISQIIKLRGGTEKIGRGGGLYMLLEILDLVHAVYFSTTPMYTTFNPQTHQGSTTPSQAEWSEQSSFDEAALEQVSNFMLDLQDFTELHHAHSGPVTAALEPTITPSSFEQEVQQWHQYLTQAAEAVAPRESGALANVCGLAAGLHLATTAPIRPSQASLQGQRDKLFTAMTALLDSAWEGLEVLHIRILLTATATCTIIAQKSWYNAHLTRELYRTELVDWAERKGMLLSFIDMQIAAWRPRPRLVRAIANGVEIIVGASEADERGLEVRSEMMDLELD